MASISKTEKASVWLGLGAGLLLAGVLTGVFLGEGSVQGSDPSGPAAVGAAGPGARGAGGKGAEAGDAKGFTPLSAEQLRLAFERAAASDRPVPPSVTGVGIDDLAALQRAAATDPNLAPSGLAQDGSYTNLAPFRDSRFYDPRDLAVLAEIIAANGLTEDSSANDSDNGDGTLDPKELGYQIWCGGRLRAFRSGPNQFAPFGYGLTVLPASVSKLELLEELDLNGNQLTQLPGNFSQLQNLRTLRLSSNQLEQFPDTVMRMGNLQELVLRDNRIQEVPYDINFLRNLRELSVEGNPVVSAPTEVMQQRIAGGMDRGFKAQTGPVLRSADCQPMG